MNRFIADIFLSAPNKNLDESLVRITADDMSIKLRQKREKDCRSGWEVGTFTMDELDNMIEQHVIKAFKDPTQWIDVINLAAMAHIKANYLGQK